MYIFWLSPGVAKGGEAIMTRNGVVVKHLLYPLWNGRRHQVFRFSSSFASRVYADIFKIPLMAWRPYNCQNLFYNSDKHCCIPYTVGLGQINDLNAEKQKSSEEAPTMFWILNWTCA